MTAVATLNKYIQASTDGDLIAIATLVEKGLHTHALTLMYSSIDKMAWLLVPGDENAGKDFKGWVDKYLLPHAPWAITADDMWAARCGLLHTGAAESRDYRKNNAKLIYYPKNMQQTEAELLTMLQPFLAQLGVSPTRVVFAPYLELLKEFGDAVDRFRQDLLQNQAMHTLAAEKAGMMLGFKIKK